MADEFFGKFTQAMVAKSEVAAPAPAQPMTPPAAQRAEEGLSPQIWVVGLISIIIILLIVFSIVL